MNMMWSPNPRRRRRKMSAKQAKYFGGKRKRRHARARRRSRSVISSPVAQHVMRRRSRRSVARVSRRRRGGGGMRMSGGTVMSLLKAGAIGGAGGVLIDVAMSQVRGFLPASMQSPADSANNPNYGYYAAKFGLALALGTLGRRLPILGRYAPEMANGAVSILGYQFLRPMVPSTMLAAYFNPAPTQRPNMGRVGAYVTPAVGVRSAQSLGRGSRAAGVLNMVNVARQAA